MSQGSTTKSTVNFYNHVGTQNLLDSLATESIRMYGTDMSYLPRRRDSFDEILGEDDTSYYDTAYGIPIYVKTAEGFMGQEAFMTNFGLEIRPQLILSVSRFQFENNIKSVEFALNRPREGDLLYFPMNHRAFEIKFVDDKPFFYQAGTLQMYDLTCELFEYAGERFSTGIAEIDSIQTRYSVDVYEFGIQNRNTEYLLNRNGDIITIRDFGANQDVYDPLQINDELQTSSNASSNNTTSLLDWSETNPYSEGTW